MFEQMRVAELAATQRMEAAETDDGRKR